MMKTRWVLKIILALGALLCSIVVTIMFTKLSFIDWPYAIGAVILITLALTIPKK